MKPAPRISTSRTHAGARGTNPNKKRYDRHRTHSSNSVRRTLFRHKGDHLCTERAPRTSTGWPHSTLPIESGAPSTKAVVIPPVAGWRLGGITTALIDGAPLSMGRVLCGQHVPFLGALSVQRWSLLWRKSVRHTGLLE